MSEADRRQRLISSTPHLSPDEIATRQFGKRPRGYAESEVRNFLKRVSEELVAARDRESELFTTIDALEEQLRQPRPLSEQELLDALGEETARLLRSAREAGDDIRRRAEQTSARVIEDARDAAARLRASADDDREHRIEETNAKVSEMLGEVETRATELRDAANAEAETIRDTARTQGREMLDEAKAARERVLGDLVRRRALLSAQIEELRGGRDRLLDAYRTVKRTFLEATEALTQVEARAASERPAIHEPLDIDTEIAAEIEALDAAATETEHAEDGGEMTQVVDIVAVDAEEAAATEATDSDNGALADVDSLFARLRAGQPEAAPNETAEASEPGAVATDADPEAAEEPEAGDIAGEPGVRFWAAEWRALRAQELDPLLAPLLKRTKRTVQDDQNALLDAVRRHKGRPTAAQVMPDDDALLGEWSAVLQDTLDVAYASGRVAAGGESRDAESALVREAAAAVVEPLRARVSAAIDSGDEGDTGGLVERIGARYREWKNQTLESSLAEALSFAWSRGVYDAVPDDAVLWWVPFEEGRCSDCDDNGLEPTKKSELFPTGQAFPPAHPGCRCLLAPATLLNVSTVG
jgi:DivIVA domain-containing protein